MPRSEVHGDDIAVESYDVLVPPGLLKQEYPLTAEAKATIQTARNASMDVIDGVDDRVLVIVGPCSIHDAAQGLEVRLVLILKRLQETLLTFFCLDPKCCT